MSADERIEDVTAVRTWNRAGNRATVTIRIGDFVRKLSGARAARCGYVLLYRDATGQLVPLGLRTMPKLADGCEAAVEITEDGVTPLSQSAAYRAAADGPDPSDPFVGLS